MATNDVYIRGRERLSRKLERVQKDISSRKILAEIGAYLKQSITNRTQHRREDIFGQAFKPYAPQYKFLRSQAGYGTEPDLTLSGRMFAALTFNASSSQVKVYFGPGTSPDVPGVAVDAPPHPEKAFYLQEKRKFFGVSAEDVDKVMELYQVNIEGALSGR